VESTAHFPLIVFICVLIWSDGDGDDGVDGDDGDGFDGNDGNGDVCNDDGVCDGDHSTRST